HVTAFYFCNFFKRPSRGPNRESLGGERAGERGAVLCLLPSGSTLRASPPARCRFLLKDRPSEEHSSRIHRGKEKVSFLRTGSLAPLQLAAKDERAELHLGRSPAGKKSLIAARAGARKLVCGRCRGLATHNPRLLDRRVRHPVRASALPSGRSKHHPKTRKRRPLSAATVFHGRA